jgi:hypothetical protein
MADTVKNYSTDNPEVAMIFAALEIAQRFSAPNGVKDVTAAFAEAHAAIRAAYDKKS